MSILAVKTFIANQAPLIPLTGTIWKQVKASRQRPKRGTAGFNVFLTVGRIRRRETRLTTPRGPAEKDALYEVEVLLYAVHSDEQVGGDSFDVFLEQVCQVYRSVVAGNPTLTDAVTGQVSYLTDMGETIEVELLPVFFLDETETDVGFNAIITFQVREVVTA